MTAKKKNDRHAHANEDPMTGEHGAHPVGVGVGTAAGAAAGVAAGIAAGAAAGSVVPIAGTVIGGIVGGVAGGLIGKSAAESMNPTDDAYWKENFSSRPYHEKGTTYEEYRPAYALGQSARNTQEGRKFEDVEKDLSKSWNSARGNSTLDWKKARPAVRDAFDRTVELSAEQLKVEKVPMQGEVRMHKEVKTEHKKIDVPVEREEVVIERRPVHKAGKGGEMKAEEIRIPIKEEKVNVSKEAVVTEEVKVSKRKHHDTKHVEGDVRKEELKVDNSHKVR